MNLNIFGSSQSMLVTSPSKPYVSQTGVVRWNGQAQRLEVMGPGNDWYALDNGGSGSVGLTPAAEATLMWAQRKMAEEANLAALMEKHPGLKDAKEKFDIMLALTKENTV